MVTTVYGAVKRNKIYDGKILWERYHEMGRAATVRKLKAIAEELGMFNAQRGHASQMGPVWAMWRYALRNPKEAYPAWEKWAKEYMEELMVAGISINFDTFLREIQEKTKPTAGNKGKAIGPGSYVEFCKKYGLEP